ncbi:MAG TPA: PAS domain S-box protein [Thermoanaerobaculia bacterium]
MKRVLLVDDNATNLEYLTVLLGAQGWEVASARHGAEALTVARECHPDLVISDLLMPVMDGYTLLRFWKSDPQLRSVPFIVYTATYTELEDERLALRLGADAFILKPAEPEAFVDRVNQVLDAARTSAPAVPSIPIEDDNALLKLYSGTLIRKLEEKTLQLQEANRLLHLDLEERAKSEALLREREAEILQWTEVMPQIVWVTRPDGWHTHFNQRWMDYTGLTLEESLGHGWLPPFHPDDRPLAAELWAHATATGEPYEIEYRLRGREGTYRWMLGRALPMRDPSGTIIKWFGTLTDIHALKQAEESANLLQTALRESENELRGLAESMPQMVWMADADGRNIYLNQRWVSYTGLSLEESHGDDWIRAFHEDDRQRAMETWQRALDGISDYSVECRIRSAGGDYRWMLVRGLPFRDQRGEIIKWMGTCTDIHDLKELNTRLREQASLLDLAHDAIIVRDLEHRVVYWNQSAERLYGWPAEAVLGRPVTELLYGDPSSFLAAAQLALEKGEWMGEIEQRTKDGRRVTVEGHWTLVRDEDGRPKSILAINTDVTARKQLEMQSLRSQRLESIGTLAGGIAHDFNNLLAPIVMGVGFLQRVETRENVLAVIRNIERSANRGKELVKQVLSFARGVQGDRVPLQLGHILREVEFIVVSTFPKNITFEGRIAPDLWLVDADPTQVQQVLLNLCVNARDAMPDGGRLLITARNAMIDEQYAVMNRGAAPGRYVELEVSDEGSGVPREVLDRMFEPFFTTKEVGKGTGLGLSTVLGIVKGHHGFLDVDSEVGRGTDFKVYLPALAETAEQVTPLLPLEELPRGRGELILIVDDELSILTVTRQTLDAFGYRTLVAEDGARAIAAYADHRDEVAAVITDMMMPVMNGRALIAALNRINPSVIIIAASGLDSEPLETNLPSVKAFLKKPYSADRLLTTLRSVLPG